MQDALDNSGRAAQRAERAEELQRAAEAAAEQSASDAQAAQRACWAAESQLAEALQSNAEVCRTLCISCTETPMTSSHAPESDIMNTLKKACTSYVWHLWQSDS